MAAVSLSFLNLKTEIDAAYLLSLLKKLATYIDTLKPTEVLCGGILSGIGSTFTYNLHHYTRSLYLIKD